MANNDSSYFIEPAIPTKDMTDLEDLVLSHMFTADKEGGLTSFYSDGAIETMPELDFDDLKRALEDSRAKGSPLFDLVSDQLKAAEGSDDDLLQLNLDLFEWETIFQPIIKRSDTVNYIIIKGVFTCSKMRSSGFGGDITMITGWHITTKSLDMIRTEMIEQHMALGLIPDVPTLPPIPAESGAS